MRIGLVGYFGWGNYGDELFVQAYRQLFAGHELVMFHDPVAGAFRADADDLIRSVDAIIIGGGDLIIPWYKSWLYWDERFLQKPVFVFGVGVPTWAEGKPEVLEHFRTFLAHPSVRMISCRDQESADWVRQNLVPDKEILFSPDMVLALRFPQRKLESRALGVILRKQDEYEVDNLHAMAMVAGDLGYELKLILLGTGRTLDDDYDFFHKVRFGSYQVVVRNSVARLSDEIAECAAVVSMKFHGTIAAYSSGVPFISLSSADKFRSFMKQNGNERYSSSWSDKELPGKLQTLVYDGFDFSRRRQLASDAARGLERLRQETLNIR